MAFNIAGNLLQTNWGQTAGQNIRENMLRAKQEQQQNLLAQALPAALGGDQNALAQVYAVDPTAGYRIQTSVMERDQAQRKQTQESIDGIESDLHGALINAPDPAAAWPTLRNNAILRAQRIGLDADVAAALPEAYTPELLLEAKGGAGIKPENSKAPPLENWQNADGSINPTLLDAEKSLRQAGAASTVTYSAPVTALDANGNPVLLQPSNRGGVLPVAGYKPAPNAGKDPTEDQSKAAAWFNQAQKALSDMKAAMAEDPRASEPNLMAETLDRVPIVGESMRNKSLTPGQQRYQQAVRSFSEATLRAATGAGVTKQEHEEKLRELTPRPGDTPQTIAQKEASMLVYLESLRNRAGRALATDQILDVNASPAPANRPPLSSFGG